MLTAIIDMLARSFGQRLEQRLAVETAERLTSFGQRIEAALATGDLTADGLAAGTVPAVEDRKRRTRS